MSHHPHYALAPEGAVTGESLPDPAIVNQPKASSSSATRNWAWGKAHEPYDWMDAHTPSDDLYAWR